MCAATMGAGQTHRLAEVGAVATDSRWSLQAPEYWLWLHTEKALASQLSFNQCQGLTILLSRDVAKSVPENLSGQE